MDNATMELPVTPPRERQSALQHRYQQDANYASPPKTPMWRTEPPTPTSNTSRKLGRGDWVPPTPTSLPRRIRQDIAPPSVEWAAGDGEDVFKDNLPVGTETEVSHEITATNPLANAFAIYWDEDIIGLVCPFCMETEIHLMPRPSNTTGVDLRVPDCDPRKQFRLLFAGDNHPAVKGRRGVWVEERRRWESVYVEDLCPEESEQESEAGEGVESTTENPIGHGYQNRRMDVLEDMEEDQRIDLSGELLLTSDGSLEWPIALSSDDEDEIITNKPLLQGNTQLLRIASSLFNQPPPEYLTLGHGQAAVVYKPVAVVPMIGAQQKTIGFLEQTTLSTRRVFTRSGWMGEEISDTDVAWLQGTLKTRQAPWQDLVFINNGLFTKKVRELSARLGIEPRHHNYDKENPVGQVCFSHVEKQLVVVALEEHQTSSHLASTESVINRTIYVNRAPCAGCLAFAEAVERTTPLRFSFIVMTRVMTQVMGNEQAYRRLRSWDTGAEGKDKETGDNAGETLSSETLSGNQGNQRPTRAKRAKQNCEYEVAAIVGKKQSIKDGLQYLVQWKNVWMTDGQLEAQCNIYSGEIEVTRETTGRRGERRRLVSWPDSWMSYGDLENSRKLIEEFERKGGRLE